MKSELTGRAFNDTVGPTIVAEGVAEDGSVSSLDGFQVIYQCHIVEDSRQRPAFVLGTGQIQIAMVRNHKCAIEKDEDAIKGR